MKDVIIHAGLHKTGSTTIQKFVMDNSKAITDECDIYVPTAGSGNGRLVGHHNLSWELRSFMRFKKKFGDWSDLRREVDETYKNRVLLTSEDFCQVKPSVVREALTKIADNYMVAFYVRRHDDMMASVYSQNVKTGEAIERPDQFFSKFLKRPKFWFDRFFDNWSEAFGEENVRVRIADREFLRDSDLISDFLGLIETGPSCGNSAHRPGSFNMSPSLETLSVIRYVASRFGTWKSGNKQKQLFFEQNLFKQMRGDLEQIGNELGLSKFRLNSEESERILREYRESNERFSKKYLPEVPLDFWERGVTEVERSAHDLPSENVIECLQKGLDRMKEKKRDGAIQTLGKIIDDIPLTGDGRWIRMEPLVSADYLS